MRRALLALGPVLAAQALACSLLTDLSGLSQPGAGGAGASGGAGAGGSAGPAGGGGSGSTGGTSTSSGVGGSGCDEKPGPPMVHLGKYCIDATEVTRGQYADFLAADVPTQNITGTPSYCAWNTTYTPAGPGTDADDFPIVNVDWCDAYAYCEWAGKRLCGRIDGGGSPFNEYNVAASSQWYNACSIGGSMAYPYGPYDPLACVGSDQDGMPGVQGSDQVEQVMSAPMCHGAAPPYDQIFDMSGNVSEWEDSCDASTGATDRCHRRGGAYIHEGSNIGCSDDSHSDRQTTSPTNGFRCCAG
jgi:formylglycine-generating enzyme required for sulfatase activity